MSLLAIIFARAIASVRLVGVKAASRDSLAACGLTTSIAFFALESSILLSIATLAFSGAAATVNFGNPTTLAVTAKAADGTTAIVLPTGSVFYSAPTTTAFTLTPDGIVSGTGLGTAVVTATVPHGGVTGADVTTTVSFSSIVGTSALTTLSNGLQGRDTVADTSTTGNPAANGDTVTVQYTGYVSNSSTNDLDSGSYTAFDTSHATSPLTVALGSNSIPAAISQAITGMKVGQVRIVIIPASQTAGLGMPATAPANAPAIYTITRSN